MAPRCAAGQWINTEGAGQGQRKMASSSGWATPLWGMEHESGRRSQQAPGPDPHAGRDRPLCETRDERACCGRECRERGYF